MSTKQFQECILLPKQEYEKILNKKNQRGGSLLPLDGPQIEDVKLETRRYLQEAEGETRLIERIKALEDVLYQILVEKKKPPTGYTRGDLLRMLRNAKIKLQNIAKKKKTVKNEVNIVQIPAQQNQDGNQDGVIIIGDEDGPGPSELKTPKTSKKVTRSTLTKLEESLKDYTPASRKLLSQLLQKGKTKKQTGNGIRKKRKKNISKKILHHWKEVR